MYTHVELVVRMYSDDTNKEQEKDLDLISRNIQVVCLIRIYIGYRNAIEKKSF